MSVFRRQSSAPEATVTRTTLDEAPPTPLISLGNGFSPSFDVPAIPSLPAAEPVDHAADAVLESAPRTYIAADAVFEGTFRGAKHIIVEGQIHGDVNAETVEIRAHAMVIGKVVSDTLTIAGKLKGDAETGDLVIRETAEISGNLLYDTIDVSRGANLDSTTRRRPAPVTAPIAAAPASNSGASGEKAKAPAAANDKASGSSNTGPITAGDVKQIGSSLMIDPKTTAAAAKA